MQLFSKIKKKIIAFKKLLFFNRRDILSSRLTSYPFISGDGFLSISDCFIIKNETIPLIFTSNDKKDIVFIENDLLEKNWVFSFAKEFKIVILHNGDNVPDISLLKKLANNGIHVFATNIDFIYKNIQPLPIGIENANLNRNGSLDYYNPIKLSKVNLKKNDSILVSFSPNNNVRLEYLKVLNKFGLSNKLNMSLDEYRRILSNSYFVISPPGNGIDCHRIWEAFYHKTIPIIEKKYYLFSNLDLPVLIVDKLEDFLQIDDNKKLFIYRNIISKFHEKIYIQWWIDLINSKIL